jgi:hypothetical protein
MRSIALIPLLFVVVLLPVSSAAQTATNLESNDIFLPAVGRLPGALLTQWRTDLTVTNVSRLQELSTVHITFTRSDQPGEIFVTRTLSPRETLVLDDVVQNTFGLNAAFGSIRITSPTPRARLTANARVYNVGNFGGQYGQGVFALPVDGLTNEHHLTGLTALGDKRTNVGISNPWSVPVGVSINLYDRDGEARGGFNTEVGPRQVMQLNDVFSHFQSGPLEGATLHIVSSFGVYTYASVVRNDTGDAHFIPGTGFARGNVELMPTTCSYAAPVRLATPPATPAGDWIVKLSDDEVDVAGRSALLAQQYGFTVKEVLEPSKVFVADLTLEQIALLRCNTSVLWISQNTVTSLP